MLARFSVRKPFTVLVAVVLVIVLGYVSFTRMTPDLFPSMDFPYVVVMTVYTGATPEKVESEVTKPIEQAAATLDGIQEIESTSSGNYSVVILQFAEDVNMDAVTMNLREHLDRLSSSWDDNVSTPTMLKINPNLLPVNVSAVAVEGYDTIQLSSFVNDTLLPQLEGIEGVASVSLSGIVSERVNVVISQKKLDLLNQKLKNAIDSQFTEPEEEIQNALKEIEENISKLDTGEKEISSGHWQVNQMEKEAKSQFEQAQQQIDDGRSQLQAAYDQARAGTLLMASYLQAAATREVYQQELNRIPEEEPTEEQAARAEELRGLIADLTAQIDEMEPNLPNAEEIAAAQAFLLAYEDQVKALDDAQALLDEKKAEADAQIRNARNQLYNGSRQINEAKEQLDTAKEQLDDATAELNDARQSAVDGTDARDIVTMQNIAGILGAQDFSMPAGYVNDPRSNTQWMVYVGDSLQTAEELNDLLLFDLKIEGADPIYLRDVADVSVVDNAKETYAKIDGENGVLLTFSKQSNYATATVSDNILKAFEQISGSYEGLSFKPLMDQGDYIHLVIDSVLQNLLIGGALAILILLIFLWDIRPTFIIACSIPISVTFAIVLMYFSGVTLNIISMAGLAVGVGMLVDNSIVVIENIYRLRRNGVTVFRAAISGAVQVTGAITASTLTTVCVFAPIVFVQGLTRQIFTDMALTITYSLLASLIVALTLIPAMSSGVFARIGAGSRVRILDWVAKIYGKVLGFILRFKFIPVAIALVLLWFSARAAIAKGFIYIPDMDSTQITVTITLDEEATLEESAAMADLVAERVAPIEEVKTVGVMQSRGTGSLLGMSSGSGSTNQLSMYIVLDEEKVRTSGAIAREIEERCSDLDCTVSASGSTMDLSILTGSGISIDIYGEDLDALQEAAKGVAEKLASIEGIGEVSDGLEDATPEFRIHVDKEEAMKHNLTTAQVYMEVAKALTNEMSVATVEKNSDQVVLIGSAEGPSLVELRNLKIKATNAMTGESETVYLKDIANFDGNHMSLQSISRTGQRRYITVKASLKDGYNVTLKTAEAQRVMDDYELPEGLRMEFAGESESIMEAMNDLLLMLILGVVIVYLIMVAQFQSLLSPFIVMFTIPLAFTGGLAALLFMDFEISIVAMIGFVMLVGIIVNNGIVLIDRMNQLREDGMERKDAVIEACRQRLRPVLMTALTTVLGLIPMAVGRGIGSAMIQPVAVVAIGGLVYATFMTLFIVPVIYDAWCKRPPRVVTARDMEIAED